jgi:hypothetical protein
VLLHSQSAEEQGEGEDEKQANGRR